MLSQFFLGFNKIKINFGISILKNPFFSPTNFQKNACYFSSFKAVDMQSSQSLLKQYFSTRLTLSTIQLQRYLHQLSKNNDVKIRDYRWESLYMTIQKYHKDFSLSSRVDLRRMKQNNQLFLTLYKSIIADFHKLTIGQMAVLLWSMVKGQQNDKTVVLAIYKKLYKILENGEKIKLHKEGAQLPDPSQRITDINDEQIQKNHHLHEGTFVHFIWAIQKTKIIDQKLILQLLKHTFQDKETNNLSTVRIQNLCLLAYCIGEMKFEKFRIFQSIINKIIESWAGLQNLSILSLVLLCQSLTKFVHYQQNYLKKYELTLTPEQVIKKQQFLDKQRRFILLTVSTILLKQDSPSKINENIKKKPLKEKNQFQENQNDIQKLNNPLSSKFASQLIFNLGKLNLYDKKIWYKLLTSITDNIDQAEVQDLSMALAGICNLSKNQIPHQDYKSLIYEQKKIICRRCFQIYTSLNGKSLQKIKELIHEKKLQNQFVPSRVRKEVEQQFLAYKIKQSQLQQLRQNKDAHAFQEQKTNKNIDQQYSTKIDQEQKAKKSKKNQKRNSNRNESFETE